MAATTLRKSAPRRTTSAARNTERNLDTLDLAEKKASVTPAEESNGPTGAVFSSQSLQRDFQAFCQANFADVRDVERLLPNLKSPIEFIDNVDFASSAKESDVFADRLFAIGDECVMHKAVKLPDMPIHLARLCETRLLKPEEERSLFQRMNYLRFLADRLRTQSNAAGTLPKNAASILSLMRAADWYRDAIVKANMRLVISIVKKFVNANNNFDDLLSDGIVALIRAVDKFDFDRGFRFSTYATQVVRRNAYRNVMTKQKERLQVTSSIDESGIDISDEARPSSMSESRWNELRSRLASMLDSLDRREKLIIRARFSLGSHRNVKTLQCLADRLGVSKERVRQLEKRSLEKLRSMVGADVQFIAATEATTDD